MLIEHPLFTSKRPLFSLSQAYLYVFVTLPSTWWWQYNRSCWCSARCWIYGVDPLSVSSASLDPAINAAAYSDKKKYWFCHSSTLYHGLVKTPSRAIWKLYIPSSSTLSAKVLYQHCSHKIAWLIRLAVLMSSRNYYDRTRRKLSPFDTF